MSGGSSRVGERPDPTTPKPEHRPPGNELPPSPAATGVLVGIFNQADPETPLAELLTHAVPRERELLALAGRTWRVGTVTWVPQPGGELLCSVAVWDPDDQAERLAADAELAARREGHAAELMAAADDAEAQRLDAKAETAAEVVEIHLPLELCYQLARALRGQPINPDPKEPDA